MNYYVGKIVLSAEQERGVIAGPKHFAGNDFETERNGISYFYREQAFREGSLRGFEGAMRDDLGGVLGAMGIYGRQGLTYSPACEALNYGVVRMGIQGAPDYRCSSDGLCVSFCGSADGLFRSDLFRF